MFDFQNPIEKAKEKFRTKTDKAMRADEQAEYIEAVKDKANQIAIEAQIKAQTERINERLAERQAEIDRQSASSKEVYDEKYNFRQRIHKASCRRTQDNEIVLEKK